MKTLRRRPARVLNRNEAAEMIRAARNAPRGSDERGELVGWAKTVLRDNYLVRRLKIDHLLDSGEHDSADALIARALMGGISRETGALMRWRFARSLHAQGRLEEAWRQISHVLAERPQHVSSLLLAAQIARKQAQFATAVELLVRACELQPSRNELRAKLVEALLLSEQVHEAAVELGRIHTPSPVLVSKVLRAQGRTLEAVELLERAATDSAQIVYSAELNLELIAALEELGDGSRLNRTLESARQVLSDSSNSPEMLLRAAHAMLSQGHFTNVLAAIHPLLGDARHCRAALPLQMAALAMLNRTVDARETFVQWRGIEAAPDVRSLAAMWLLALFGQTLVEAVEFRSAGRDPALEILKPMLTRAAAVLDQATREPAPAGAMELAALSKHRDTCLRALGSVAFGPSEADRSASIHGDTGSPTKGLLRRAA